MGIYTEAEINDAIKVLEKQRNEFNDRYIDYAGVNKAYGIAMELLSEYTEKVSCKMPEGNLLLTIDDEGKAHLYDSKYDITIHCESEEEREKAINKLISIGKNDE